MCVEGWICFEAGCDSLMKVRIGRDDPGQTGRRAERTGQVDSGVFEQKE